jgi:hypothetical protein
MSLVSLHLSRKDSIPIVLSLQLVCCFLVLKVVNLLNVVLILWNPPLHLLDYLYEVKQIMNRRYDYGRTT